MPAVSLFWNTNVAAVTSYENALYESFHIQLFRERLSEKKTSKCTRQDRKVVWVFSGILHIGLEEIYKFVFLHVENSSQEAYICSFTFTVACL